MVWPNTVHCHHNVYPTRNSLPYLALSLRRGKNYQYELIQFLTSENCFVIVLSWLLAFGSNILPSDRYAFSRPPYFRYNQQRGESNQRILCPPPAMESARVMRIYIFNMAFSWYTGFGQRSSENKREETECKELILAKLYKEFEFKLKKNFGNDHCFEWAPPYRHLNKGLIFSVVFL